MREREYDLFVPLHYNDGTPIEPEKIARLKQRLIERFGGLTHFPQSNEGFWKVGRVTFRDRIIILRVLADASDAGAECFLLSLKEEMTRAWHQEEVLVVARDVSVL